MIEVALSDARVGPLWQMLQSKNGVVNPFLSWQWMSALAADPALTAPVRVLLVVEQARCLGLFPIERTTGPGRLRALGPAGWRWWHPDHLDVVAPPRDRPAVASAIVEHLRSDRSWDLLDLAALDQSGALAAAAGGVRPRSAVRLPERPVLAPYVELSDRAPAELIRSRTLREQVGRSRRRAERGGGSFCVVQDPTEAAYLLVELMRLHNDRFGSTSTVFFTAERRAFHQRAVRNLAGAGMARIYRFAGPGDTEAGLLYALIQGSRAYYYALGINAAAAMSPGRTVLGQAILAAAQEGLSEFDLLRGDHAFKQRFASGTRSDRRITVLRPTVRTTLSLRALARLRGRDDQPRQVQEPGETAGYLSPGPAGGHAAPATHGASPD